jgi:CheY-like chemotaxis protein
MDTGIGIAEDERARIFEEFYQVGEGARDGEQGLGLGLAIVRGSATLVGGEVDVESVPGRGSCFSISVPRTEPVVSVPEVGARAKPSEWSRLILVVDDDPAIRDAMRHLLEAWGHAVLTADSLDEAVERARQRPGIDLLLTDYRLPQGATGIETVDAVRAALAREIEAAIITGDTSPQTLRGIQTRELRLLHKPLDEEELRALVSGRSHG